MNFRRADGARHLHVLSGMLKPHQQRSLRERKGRRAIEREHGQHPQRELERAVDRELEKAKRRP